MVNRGCPVQLAGGGISRPEYDAEAWQRVGWVERSETHQFLARKNDGFRKGSTHPTDCARALADRGSDLLVRHIERLLAGNRRGCPQQVRA
jgi:hypothetical protein